jgi:hypothetical protein
MKFNQGDYYVDGTNFNLSNSNVLNSEREGGHLRAAGVVPGVVGGGGGWQ